jgi:pyroglutamyl-peptidase
MRLRNAYYPTRHSMMLGLIHQADRQARISLERFAVNIMDARIPDNDGNQPRDQAIQDRGPQAHRSGLPLRAMEKALLDSGIPAHISDSAGTYVCNYIFYQLRHHFPEIPGGFVHVPLCTEQVLSSRGTCSVHDHGYDRQEP